MTKYGKITIFPRFGLTYGSEQSQEWIKFTIRFLFLFLNTILGKNSAPIFTCIPNFGAKFFTDGT